MSANISSSIPSTAIYGTQKRAANHGGSQVIELGKIIGRDGEIRTRDLTHPKRARYQAAPRPVKVISSMAGKAALSNVRNS
jgi:hypothetical protein